MGDTPRDIFAAQLEISEKTLGNYERGDNEPTVTVLQKYHQRYGVSVNWIVSGEGQMFEDVAVSLMAAADMQSALIRKLARIVERLHQGSPITLRSEDIAAEAAVLYDEIRKRVDDLSDEEEIEAVMPQIELIVKKRIREATEQPGTGKRTA